MKPFSAHLDIDLPRERVIALFDDPDNLPKWQPGLVSFEHLSGEPGKPGAKSKLVYLNGKRQIELIETVTARNLPDEFHGRYDWDGGHNTIQNRFVELGPNRTRWEVTGVFEFKSVGMKLMGLLFRGMFRKQNMKFMENFKAFAEKGRDIRKPG